MSASQDSADMEKGQGRQIERNVTSGGHTLDESVSPMPSQHRKIGNPAPLGLLSFGCGFFVVSACTLHAQGVHVQQIAVPLLMLYGGVFQSIVGLIELFTGNTFLGRCCIWLVWRFFNLSYAGIFVPAFGVLDAYTVDGQLTDEFNQALGLYLIAWFMVSLLFVLGSLRTNASVLVTLVFTALAFLTLAISVFTGKSGWATAGGSLGMCAAAASWWAALSAFWDKTTTFSWLRLPPISLAANN